MDRSHQGQMQHQNGASSRLNHAETKATQRMPSQQAEGAAFDREDQCPTRDALSDI